MARNYSAPTGGPVKGAIQGFLEAREQELASQDRRNQLMLEMAKHGKGLGKPVFDDNGILSKFDKVDTPETEGVRTALQGRFPWAYGSQTNPEKVDAIKNLLSAEQERARINALPSFDLKNAENSLKSLLSPQEEDRTMAPKTGLNKILSRKNLLDSSTSKGLSPSQEYPLALSELAQEKYANRPIRTQEVSPGRHVDENLLGADYYTLGKERNIAPGLNEQVAERAGYSFPGLQIEGQGAPKMPLMALQDLKRRVADVPLQSPPRNLTWEFEKDLQDLATAPTAKDSDPEIALKRFPENLQRLMLDKGTNDPISPEEAGLSLPRSTWSDILSKKIGTQSKSTIRPGFLEHADGVAKGSIDIESIVASFPPPYSDVEKNLLTDLAKKSAGISMRSSVSPEMQAYLNQASRNPDKIIPIPTGMPMTPGNKEALAQLSKQKADSDRDRNFGLALEKFNWSRLKPSPAQENILQGNTTQWALVNSIEEDYRKGHINPRKLLEIMKAMDVNTTTESDVINQVMDWVGPNGEKATPADLAFMKKVAADNLAEVHKIAATTFSDKLVSFVSNNLGLSLGSDRTFIDSLRFKKQRLDGEINSIKSAIKARASGMQEIPREKLPPQNKEDGLDQVKLSKFVKHLQNKINAQTDPAKKSELRRTASKMVQEQFNTVWNFQ